MKRNQKLHELLSQQALLEREEGVENASQLLFLELLKVKKIYRSPAVYNRIRIDKQTVNTEYPY